MNLQKITNSVVINSDTVEGMLGDYPIKVYRRLSGWHIHIVVEVDGIKVHDSVATEQDKTNFSYLFESSFLTAAVNREVKRDTIMKYVTAAGLFDSGD